MMFTRTTFLVSLLVCTVAAIPPTVTTTTYETHVGIPITKAFMYNAQGNVAGDGEPKFEVLDILPTDGKVSVTDSSFTYTPYFDVGVQTDHQLTKSFQYRVKIGGVFSSYGTITIIQTKYICTSDCPSAARWHTHYYLPLEWGPKVKPDDLTLNWENNGLVLRMLGYVGEGGQRFGGFKEFKFNPITVPFMTSTYAPGLQTLTFDKSCLDNKPNFPDQFNGPPVDMCSEGTLSDETLCNNAPLLSIHDAWQMDWGADSTPCKYRLTARYPFKAIMPDKDTTVKFDDGRPLWDVTLPVVGDRPQMLIITSNFYVQVVQPNNPKDVSRGWEDKNFKYLLKVSLQTEVDNDVELNIFTCDPKCEVSATTGNLVCVDYCTEPYCTTGRPCPTTPPPTSTVPPEETTTVPPEETTTAPPGETTTAPPCVYGRITSALIVYSTFDTAGCEHPTQTRTCNQIVADQGVCCKTSLTYTQYDDGTFTFNFNIDSSAADETGGFQGKIIMKVCPCGWNCATYTRLINLRVTSYSINGGFVGRVRTCRANPLKPNPLSTSADICEEVDALTFGPPDRATLFFDIINVDAKYTEPTLVQTQFSANGIETKATLRNSGYGASDDAGLTGEVAYLGYHELTKANREKTEDKVDKTDFAFTVLPGVINDNFKMTWFVTLKIHSTPVANEPTAKPFPTNPFLTEAPKNRRFQHLGNAQSPENLVMCKNAIRVEQRFSSINHAKMLAQHGFRPGRRDQVMDGHVGSSAETATYGADMSKLFIAGAVCGAAVVLLLIGAVAFGYTKYKKAQQCVRVNSEAEMKSVQ